MFVDHNSLPNLIQSANRDNELFARRLMLAVLVISIACIVLAAAFSWLSLLPVIVFVALIFAFIQYKKAVSSYIEKIQVVAAEREQFFMGIIDACDQPCSVTALGHEGEKEWRWLYVNGPVQAAFQQPLPYFLDKSCNQWGANICNTKDCGRECLSQGNPETKFAQDFGAGLNHFRVYTKTFNDLEGKPSYVVEWVDATEETKYQLVNAFENVVKLSTDSSTATKEVSSNIHTVAVASEELSTSIEEISRSAEAATRVADEVETLTKKLGEEAQEAGHSVLELEKMGNQIEEISKVIGAIAEQTNLLALNASIEAARAGEAGRGFAVVAGEVKSLAERTHVATTEIASKVVEIKQQINTNVSLITAFSDRVVFAGKQVQDVKASMQSVATSVTQQAAAVQEIAQNASRVSDGTEVATESVNLMLAAVEETRTKVT